MKKHIPSHLIICCCITAALAAFTACSHIDEDERLIMVDQNIEEVTDPVTVLPDSVYDAPVAVVERRVLIEDHTGQKCHNCPHATTIIHNLQRVYGSRIVPVAIHSQAQGIMEPSGLGNELGNTYYNNWKLEFKPAGLVNRMDGGDGVVLDKTIWTMAVQYLLSDETPDPLDIRIKAEQQAGNPQQASVSVKVISTSDASVSGKLQVWITEDNIVAQQDSMGTHISNYVHNHVLRASVNGTWGEDVSVSGFGGTKEFHYDAPLSSAWKPENLAIVAFVYNDDGVVQVQRQVIKQINN